MQSSVTFMCPCLCLFFRWLHDAITDQLTLSVCQLPPRGSLHNVLEFGFLWLPADRNRETADNCNTTNSICKVCYAFGLLEGKHLLEIMRKLRINRSRFQLRNVNLVSQVEVPVRYRKPRSFQKPLIEQTTASVRL